ncbi:hypothetical protein [Erythrobacter sp. MTPC3]|uniref:hypothetical protein n=1 Tax=Erythrobacter sp. MTPC3 TaxID=3056564 RepID=UPI0036F266DA
MNGDPASFRLKMMNTLGSGYLAVIVCLLVTGATWSHWIARPDAAGVYTAELDRSLLSSPSIDSSGNNNVSAAPGEQMAEASTSTAPPLDAATQPPEELLQAAEEVAAQIGQTAATGSIDLAQLEFDLGEQTTASSDIRPAGGSSIEVAKAVFAGGTDIGTLTVTVDRNARLFVRGTELARILASPASNVQPPPQIASNDLVSFQRLRETGIDLRYDPIEDRIILQP